MNKLILTVLLLSPFMHALDIPVEYAKVRTFSKSIELNSKVIQLSNAQQSIMSLLSGHIEKYYVEPGSMVKNNQKIALINSIKLSQMTAEYISLKEQFLALNNNYSATKKLYDKGMTSMQELNEQSMKKNAMSAKIDTLQSQLETLGINTQTLNKASSEYILYAHSSGRVSELLQSLHSVISEDTPIISIVKSQAFYIKSYLPLEYASLVKVGQKIVVNYNDRDIVTYITQILPALDEKTQRIILLSSVDEKADDLYINAYLGSKLYIDTNEKHVAVKKSALSFFKNEWVVFVPKEEEGHKEHDEHEEDKHNESEKHDEHESKDEHVDEEVAYEARVVDIINKDNEYAGVNGLAENEEYVSDKSYYVKSMMLKSSLGGHGH
ncbi:MAG: efflux RND transporter periplasmic adaptor subunit [Sulfurimonas sp.]|nr:efflux RND transporter periplasmic adaptor subunit [Sulfurimonas sp.]